MTLRINNSSGNLKVVNGQGGRLRPNVDVEAVLPVAFEDLVAFYPFRQGTGADVTAGDSRFGDTTDNSATVNGATFKPDSGVHDIQNGANSGAFQFDGGDDFLSDVKALTGTGVTVLAQINTTTANSSFGRVYSTRPDNNNNGLEVLTNTNQGTLFLFVGDGSSRTRLQVPIATPTNGFIQVGLRYDGQTLEAIRDGLVVDSIPSTEVPTNTRGLIGKRLDAETFGGIIDSVRLYDAVLSDSQIYQIYKNTRPATRIDKLAARYTFNDGAAQDQTAGVPVSGDSTDYSGTLNGTAEAENEGVNDG